MTEAREGTFVAGKPITDIWAPPGLAWRSRLEAQLSGPLLHPRLHFVRNDKHRYDIDNLAYPVLDVLGPQSCVSVWATVEVGIPEGVWVSDEYPPPAEGESVYIACPPSSSVPGRPPLPELVDRVAPPDGHSPLGLALAFDSGDTRVASLSFEGPTKSLIDDLGPLLGVQPYMGRMVSNDRRVKELRITRGHAPAQTGVTVTVWKL